VKLTIDGKTVTANKGESILECALRNDIQIPHLCNHPCLSPFGACRLCVVEVEGMRGYPTSCTTPAAEGMEVRVNTEALRNLRRNILGLMMLEHPSACLVCSKRELCEEYRPHSDKAGRTTGCHTCNNKEFCEVRLLAEELGPIELAVAPIYHNRPIERAEPFIDRDLNLCILCGRCVRICKHQHGAAVIDFIGRSGKTHIGGAFERSLQESGCKFCGSCIDVCPTGSLAERYAKWYGGPDNVGQTTCIFCGAACALEVGTKENKVIVTKAVNEGMPICVLGRFAVAEFLNGGDRLSKPYIRVGKVLRQMVWEETLKTAAGKLKDFAGSSFAFVCDTTSSLEDRFIFKKFTAEVMKSPNYIEVKPDERGVSQTSLPNGVKAAVATGDFIDSAGLAELELLIVQDCFPTEISKRADVVLPAAVFTEIDGTVIDDLGQRRPLHKVCEPPGQAKAEWRIICELAKAMGAEGFDYESAAAIAKELGISNAELWVERDNAPEAAADPKLRRTHFRGHRIDSKVAGLRELPLDGDKIAETTIPASNGTFQILEKCEIVPNIHEIIINAPEVAKKALPGQFVIVMVDEKSERVPYTLCDWDAGAGTITLVVLEVGQSSRKLALLQKGDRLEHVTGPLGVALEIKNYGTVALTAGCYGIGAIVPIARAMKEACNYVVVITEARSHYLSYYGEKLRGFADEFIESTIDGSNGIKGHAVDVLAEKLKKGEKIDCVVAIGCPFMMMLTGRETKPYNVKTLAALNPIMVDGTGMCGACRLTVGGKMKFACVDGPFFDAHLVDWDEVRDRRVAYSAAEIHSVARSEPVTPSGDEHKCMKI